MFTIIFDKKAIHYLNQLESSVKERIWNKLQNCKEDPLRYFEKLVEINGFKLRVGDWGVIANIDGVNKQIIVVKVGHRKNVYER